MLSAPGCPPGGTHHPPRAAGPDAACSAAHIPPPLPGPLLHSPWRHPWRASQLIVASNNDSCPALHTTNTSRRRTSGQAAQAKQGCEDARDGTARAAGPTAQRKIAPPSSVEKTLGNHHLMQTPAPYPNIPTTQHNGRRKDKKSPSRRIPERARFIYPAQPCDGRTASLMPGINNQSWGEYWAEDRGCTRARSPR